MTRIKFKGHIPSRSRELLRLAYLLDQGISSKLQQAEALRALAGQVRNPAGHMGKPTARILSENRAVKDEALSKLAELEGEIAEDIGQLIDRKREIRELIHSLPTLKEQLVLELKYLHYRTWQEVADNMNYSYRQIQRLHQQILRKLDKNRQAG